MFKFILILAVLSAGCGSSKTSKAEQAADDYIIKNYSNCAKALSSWSTEVFLDKESYRWSWDNLKDSKNGFAFKISGTLPNGMHGSFYGDMYYQDNYLVHMGWSSTEFKTAMETICM
jgi:hypothetical protein